MFDPGRLRFIRDHAGRLNRTRLAAVVAAVAVVGALAVPAVAPVAAAGSTFHVATNGSDSASGSASSPWRTVKRGLTGLSAGDTLIVHGGTYSERITGASVRAGTSSARITVKAATGERPVIAGLLWLKGLSYWTFDGINVTWAGGSAGEHMVKFTDGVGWVFQNGEVWGAHSYANILVTGNTSGQPSNWTIRNSCIHDTYPSNQENQDHNIYVNTGSSAGKGLIEGNVLYNATNGRNIKLGPSSSGSNGTVNVTIRYNTLYNAAQNISLSYGSSNNTIERNIIGKSGGSYSNVYAYNLNGKGNVARDNIGFSAPKLLGGNGGGSVADGGGNRFPLDPSFNSTSSCKGFVPRNSTATAYGYAAVANPGPISTPIPSPATTPKPTITPAPTARATATPIPTPDPTITPAPTATATATPTVQPTVLPTAAPPSTAARIVLRNVSSGTVDEGTSLRVLKPAGVAAGDVLLASLDIRGNDNTVVTPPSGWRLVRDDVNGNVLHKVTWVRIAGAAEPASYAWALSRSQSAAGSILAFDGVDTTNPIVGSSGAVGSGYTIAAGGVAVPMDGAAVVGFYGMGRRTTIAPPTGFTEAAEAGNVSATYKATAEAAWRSAGAGWAGSPTATAAHDAPWIGHLVTLRPAAI